MRGEPRQSRRRPRTRPPPSPRPSCCCCRSRSALRCRSESPLIFSSAHKIISNILHEISTTIIYLQSVSVQASVCGIDGGGSSAGGVHLLRKRHVGKDVFQALVENGVELFGNLKQLSMNYSFVNLNYSNRRCRDVYFPSWNKRR